MKFFESTIRKYDLESLIANEYKEQIDGVDRSSALSFFSKIFQLSIGYLSPKMSSEISLHAMKTELLDWAQTIERQFLHKRADDLRRDYLNSWIISTKLEHQGKGWLRTNFATCCYECYHAHRIYLEFDEALDLELFPFDKCTNTSGCICTYVWKSKDDPIAKHPWFPNERNWRDGS